MLGWLSVAVATAVVAGCSGVPAPTPSRSVQSTSGAPSATGGGQQVEVRTSATVDSTVRWTDGDQVREHRITAGQDDAWTVNVPAVYLLVITVAGDGAGKVSCSITDAESGPSRSVTTDPGEPGPVATCDSGAPPLRQGYEPDPTKAHLVQFAATSSADMMLLWLTANGRSKPWYGSGTSTASDRVDSGTAMVVVANLNGVSSCEVRLDGKPASQMTVHKPGEIALCGAKVG
jgi:hypothetical protein